MYWNKDIFVNTNLRENVTYLLQNLYDRNARHSFCPDTVWIAEELQDAPPLDYRDDRVRLLLKYVPFCITFQKRLKLFYDIIATEKEQYVTFSHLTRAGFKATSPMPFPSALEETMFSRMALPS